MLLPVPLPSHWMTFLLPSSWPRYIAAYRTGPLIMMPYWLLALIVSPDPKAGAPSFCRSMSSVRVPRGPSTSRPVAIAVGPRLLATNAGDDINVGNRPTWRLRYDVGPHGVGPAGCAIGSRGANASAAFCTGARRTVRSCGVAPR